MIIHSPPQGRDHLHPRPSSGSTDSGSRLGRHQVRLVSPAVVRHLRRRVRFPLGRSRREKVESRDQRRRGGIDLNVTAPNDLPSRSMLKCWGTGCRCPHSLIWNGRGFPRDDLPPANDLLGALETRPRSHPLRRPPNEMQRLSCSPLLFVLLTNTRQSSWRSRRRAKTQRSSRLLLLSRPHLHPSLSFLLTPSSTL